MESVEKIVQLLMYRDQPHLAEAIKGSKYCLNESTTYGSRAFSRLTTVEIMAPLHKFEQLQKLDQNDRKELVDTFRILYPVRDDDVEIIDVEFLVDPDSPIPDNLRKANALEDIDFGYIQEQVKKCDEKVQSGDYEGAITNARSLIESICKYVLDNCEGTYSSNDPLRRLYSKAAKVLKMHPSQHVEGYFKEILSGCTKVISGFGSIRNELSDAHGKSQKKLYRPDKRHARFVVSVAKAQADFMYASLSENNKD